MSESIPPFSPPPYDFIEDYKDIPSTSPPPYDFIGEKKEKKKKKKKQNGDGWGAYMNCKKKLERFLGQDIELPQPKVDNSRRLQREERNRLRDAELERVNRERQGKLTQQEINDRVFREYQLYGVDRAEELERELERNN